VTPWQWSTPAQTPAVQTSPVVFGSPSSQGVNCGLTVCVQLEVAASQVPAWQASASAQAWGLQTWLTQWPLKHSMSLVQYVPSKS
jgi:hypothetical protein